MNYFDKIFHLTFSYFGIVASSSFRIFLSFQFAAEITLFFFKLANSGLFLFIFFFSRYNFNKTNWKKRRWCARDSNPGSHDGRHKRNHGAIAATGITLFEKHQFQSQNQLLFFVLTVNKDQCEPLVFWHFYALCLFVCLFMDDTILSCAQSVN